MLDIREVITILCKCLNDSLDSQLTPEHFRLAKYDKNTDDVVDLFWTTLDKYTYFVIQESNNQITFADLDKYVRTKLRLAYLQYPLTEIYSYSESTNKFSSRILLITLTWLITKHDILENLIRLKLINSSLGREFSKAYIDNRNNIEDTKSKTLTNQIHSLLVKTNKLSTNLKAISELYTEKVKLMTKVHTASITASGLPHLSVLEMALIKKIAVNKDKGYTETEKMKDMEKTASMLETYIKWKKKSHTFLTWMNTVLDEFEKTKKTVFDAEALTELSRFICLLRHLTRKKISSVKNNSDLDFSNTVSSCPSKFLRIQKSITEAQMCLNETMSQFNIADDNLQKNRADLELELKHMLSMMPNCVQI